jgi:hypothetical protein
MVNTFQVWRKGGCAAEPFPPCSNTVQSMPFWVSATSTSRACYCKWVFPVSVLQLVNMGDSQSATHIALLAPVPFVHLKSAIQADRPDRQVAFATKEWELFNKLDGSRAGMPVDVYIYESHPEGSFEGKATWHARYVRLETDRHKAKAYRPESTETDTFEGEVYWIVELLRRMESNEHIPVTDFVAFGSSKPYAKSFPPHRPLLVQHPL